MTENALHSAARVACRAEAGKLARVAKLLPNGTRPLWRARHLRRGPGLACVVVMFRQPVAVVAKRLAMPRGSMLSRMLLAGVRPVTTMDWSKTESLISASICVLIAALL
jgi:hypothetical protein